MRNHDRPAIGKSKFIAPERRNPSLCRMIEIIPRVKRRVAQKLKDRSVKAALPRARDDVRKASRPATDLRRHPPRARLNLLDRIHVEVRERAASHLGIARIRAVHGKRRLHAALPVDGKLLREVRRSVRVSHRACGQQQELAEVPLVQGQFTHRTARQLFTATCRRLVLHLCERERALVRQYDRSLGRTRGQL